MNILPIYFNEFYARTHTTANSAVLALLFKPFLKFCCRFVIGCCVWFFSSDFALCSGEGDILEVLNKLQEEKIQWIKEKEELETALSDILERESLLEEKVVNLEAQVKSLGEEKGLLESKNHVLSRQGIDLIQENMNLSQENVRLSEQTERLREELAKYVDTDLDISEDSL